MTDTASTASDNMVNVLLEAGRLEVRSAPRPTPGPLEVLVEVASVGICGSDVHYYQHGRIGDFVVEQPLVLGHESSGRIVEVGADVPADRVGQRVAVEPGIPCGRCEQCRHGRYNLCPDVRFLATPPIDGAFARYISVHTDFAHAVPDEVSDDEAALLEPVSVGVWSNRRANVGPDDHVLVTGAGPIGLLCAQVARASGAASVSITDVAEERLAFARTVEGLTVLDGRETDLESLDPKPTVLLECSGVEPVVGAGLRALAPAGRAILVGMGSASEQTIPVSTIQAHELWVTGCFRYANTYPTALRLVRDGLVDAKSLVSAHFGLAEAEDALLAPGRDPSILKAVVHPGR